MSFVKSGISALGKLLIVAGLLGMFAVGMATVLYLSLQGQEVKVPEIVGKNFAESEKELASLGLRIKKRADRYSEEQPNTVLEQLPKPGETVKTGQMILVVTSKTNPEGEEKPATLKKGNQEEDDSEKIEELISDKPKKKAANSNSNVNKKKSSTTRDVLTDDSNTASSTSVTNTKSDEGDEKKEPKGTATPPANKQGAPANTDRPAAKPSGVEPRPRKTP